MHDQIFISGVWWSGAYYLADIASVNGYDLGRRLNSRNDNVFAWKTGPFYSMDGNYSPGSLQDILETKWPFDVVDQEDSDSFKNRIIQARSPHNPEHNCCKLSTFCMMTPLISSAFPKSPIINVVRNPIDVAMYESDNYFLRLLVQDRVKRPPSPGDIDFVDAVGHLFTALGDLRWKMQPFSENGWQFETREKPVFWNLLYVLRWAMIQDRLKYDIEELEFLQDILKIPGKMQLPVPPKSEVFKFKSDILPTLEDKDLSNKIEVPLRIIYHICKPYLKELGYTEIIETFEKLRIAK